MFFNPNKNIHFVGIGGAGMSGLAEVLLHLDYKITGSDIENSPIIERLSKLGVNISIGHRAENIKGAEVVVYSSAIKKKNIELITAKQAHIPVISRAEMLSELMRLKYGIAVSGAHGKTTTTSLISLILTFSNTDPTCVIGGRFNNIDGGYARVGKGRYMIIETDESDGSFLKFSPIIAVVTNIDLEHLDYYKNIKSIKEAFIEFMNKVPFYGCVIVSIDDKIIEEIIRKNRINRRVITYSIYGKEGADYKVVDIRESLEGSQFKVLYKDELLGEVSVNYYGLHYISNTLAAIAVAKELEIDFNTITQALKNYKGVQRRLEVKYKLNGLVIMDDYAHHPTEIKATLSAIKKLNKDKRLIVIFQPHRYTRVKFLYKEFAKSFHDADIVILTDIYSACEDTIKGVSSQLIFKFLKKYHPCSYYIDNFEKIICYLIKIIKKMI